jgi:hypothetical protein
MTAIAWATFGTTIGIVSPWLFLHLRRISRHKASGAAGRRRNSPPEIEPAGTKYHSVSIRLALIPCAAAIQLQGQRFVSAEAPQLPLAGCDQPDCECRYQHHADRRDSMERRDGFGRFGGFDPNLHGEERRILKDRRGR